MIETRASDGCASFWEGIARSLQQCAGGPFPNAVEGRSADAVALASLSGVDSRKILGDNPIAFDVAEMFTSDTSIFGHACDANAETPCQNSDRLGTALNLCYDFGGELDRHASNLRQDAKICHHRAYGWSCGTAGEGREEGVRVLPMMSHGRIIFQCLWLRQSHAFMQSRVCTPSRASIAARSWPM